MEITPELIADYEFSTAMRGFDVDEVNEFLENVGTELARTQHQLRKALDRVAALEADLEAAQAQANDSQSTIEVDARRAARALLAAQETADRIEADANAEAETVRLAADAAAQSLRANAESDAAAIRANAEEQAAALRSSAHAEAEQLHEDAVAEAHRLRDGTIAELDEQISSLSALSSELQTDVSALESRSEQYREVIRTMVGVFQEVLDDSDKLFTQGPIELRVNVPSAKRAVSASEPEAAEESDDWDRGTWHPEMAEGEDSPESEAGDYPLGAETTEVPQVDVLGTQEVEVVVVDHDDEAAEDSEDDEWTSAFDGPDVTAPRLDHPWDDDATDAHEAFAAAEADVPAASAGDRGGDDLDSLKDTTVMHTVSVTEEHSAVTTSGVDGEGEYTAEFDTVDLADFDAPENEEPKTQQLQAFAGEVDAFQSSPYVPNQVFGEADEPEVIDAPPLDMADPDFGGFATAEYAAFDDEAFHEAGYSDGGAFSDAPAAGSTSVDHVFEFQGLDGGADPGIEYDDRAFGGSSSGDRYLAQLEDLDGYDREDEPMDKFDAFMSSEPPPEPPPKKRFRRR